MISLYISILAFGMLVPIFFITYGCFDEDAEPEDRVFALVIAGLFFACIFSSYHLGVEDIRGDAIKTGVGEYYLDNNKKEFRFIVPVPEAETN